MSRFKGGLTQNATGLPTSHQSGRVSRLPRNLFAATNRRALLGTRRSAQRSEQFSLWSYQRIRIALSRMSWNVCATNQKSVSPCSPRVAWRAKLRPHPHLRFRPRLPPGIPRLKSKLNSTVARDLFALLCRPACIHGLFSPEGEARNLVRWCKYSRRIHVKGCNERNFSPTNNVP